MSVLVLVLVALALPFFACFVAGVLTGERFRAWQRAWTAKAKKLERQAARDGA